MEVCERFFQLLQLRCRAMYFDSCEIAHREQFREQLANVVQMCENAFGVSVTFCTNSAGTAMSFSAAKASPSPSRSLL